MAGNWPDPPGNRLAYDRDGTQVVLLYKDFTKTIGVYPNRETDGPQPGPSHIQKINSENFDTLYSTTIQTGLFAGFNDYGAVALIFPTLRDLKGIWVPWAGGSAPVPRVWTSTDTTNGLDGTWTEITGLTFEVPSRQAMRNAINVLDIPGVKGIRCWFKSDAMIHVYGHPSSLGNRLVFWHPTLDQPLWDTPGLTDWGNRPRETQATKQVRVKNTSGSLTAQDVTVGIEALSDGTPTLVSQYQLSYGGGPGAASVSLGTLNPGAVSGVITVQQDLLASSPLGIWDQRLTATAVGWS